MTPEQKSWIDGASYEDLLRKWRFVAPGDPFFQGDTGEYYQEMLVAKRSQIGNAAHVAASKRIGWER